VPAKVAEHTPSAQATEAEEAHAHCQRFSARAKRAPPATGLARRARSRRVDRARDPRSEAKRHKIARAGARALQRRAAQGPQPPATGPGAHRTHTGV